MNYSETPVFKHDCDDCKFMGHVMNHDLYCCSNLGSIIMRYSSEGKDYHSGVTFAQESFFNKAIKHYAHNDDLIILFLYRETMLRAIARGYVTNPSLEYIK